MIQPKVAATAPPKPAIRIPTKGEVFTASGPGVSGEIVMISVNSCKVSQACRSMTCWRISGIVA